MDYFICMDSGGTTTNTYALDIDGNIIKQITTGCGSPAVDYDYAIKNILDSIEYIYKSLSNDKLLFIELGISGLGAVDSVNEFTKQIEIKYGVPCEILTDAHIALIRVCDIKKTSDAIILVAGTGNACLGIKNGEFHLTGGGGPLLNEQGSAYSFTHELALKIKDHYEKGIKYTKLQRHCLAYFKCESFPELKTYFYRHTKEEIAKYAQYALTECYNLEVESLIKKQAKYLVNQVLLQYSYFKYQNKVILGLLGGFFFNNVLLNEEINKNIKKHNLNIEIITNIDKVYLGALLRVKTNISKVN